MPVRVAKWETDEQFNSGSPVLNNVEVVGSGEDAYLALARVAGETTYIHYDNVAEYVSSDPNKIIADFNDSHDASLKLLSGDSFFWHFTTPANYTYNTTLLEVILDAVRLKDLRPLNATFHASYTSSINGNWGDGILTGTGFGSPLPIITDGKLNLTGGVERYVQYSGVDNCDNFQTGAIRIEGYTPNYTGAPADDRYFFTLVEDPGNNRNVITLLQRINGAIKMQFFNSGGGKFLDYDTPIWLPTAGVPYEIELNWNLNGSIRLFINGTQLGVTQSVIATRTACNFFLVGQARGLNETSNAFFDKITVFDTVQHTANYTPGAFISETIYSLANPIISPVLGFAFTSPLDTFEETAIKVVGSNEIRYQISSDNLTTVKYWNGLAWVERSHIGTAKKATSITVLKGTLSGTLTNILTLDGNLFIINETGGTPGLNVEIDFDNSGAAINQITLYARYSGNPSHVTNVDIYNYVTLLWVTLGVIPSTTGGIIQYNYPVTGTLSNYRDPLTGDIRVRINQTNSGVAGHTLAIDYIFLSLAENPSTTWWYNNQANEASVVDSYIESLAVSGIFNFVSFHHSANGNTRAVLDKILVATEAVYYTDDDLYIDTTDLSQLDLSVCIGGCLLNSEYTLPVNTEIRVLFSVDGRITWQTFSGGVWVSPVFATMRQYATLLDDAVTNFHSLDTQEATLDIRLFLKTNDFLVSPLVDFFSITSFIGYETSGSYESVIYKPENSDNGVFLRLLRYEMKLFENTSLTIQVRYVDSGLEDGFTTYDRNSNIDFGGDIIQWRAIIESDGFKTPWLYSVNIEFLTQIGVLSELLTKVKYR